MEPSIPVWLLGLLPLLFVVHDLEEILFLHPWLNRNRAWLRERFPMLSRRLFAHFDRITVRAFAAMAAEELLLIIGATLYAALSHNYYLWLALLLAFTLHLVIHLVQCMFVRRYIPVLATSLACLPVCAYVIREIVRSEIFSAGEWILCTVAGTAAAAVNLWLIHRISARISRKE